MTHGGARPGSGMPPHIGNMLVRILRKRGPSTLKELMWATTLSYAAVRSALDRAHERGQVESVRIDNLPGKPALWYATDINPIKDKS